MSLIWEKDTSGHRKEATQKKDTFTQAGKETERTKKEWIKKF